MGEDYIITKMDDLRSGDDECWCPTQSDIPILLFLLVCELNKISIAMGVRE